MKNRIFEVYADAINPYTNKSRQTRRYITLAVTGEEAVGKAKAKHTDGEWRYSATVVDEDLYLIDVSEE